MEASFFLSPLRGFCGTGVPAPTCRRSALHPGGILQRHSPCAHLCGRSAPRPGLLSRVEKVGKDTPGTSWSLDPRHKGEDPLGFPREGLSTRV